MEIKFKLIGTMKFIADVGGKSEAAREIADGGTVEDALRAIGMNDENGSKFKFTTVNGKKVGQDYALSPGDEIKVFPRSFGG
jgi:molybdopterin converting factor small subunit